VKSIITIALSAFVLAGCVRAHTSMLDERTAIISARGTAFDSMAEVQQRVIVDAANTALSRGFRYFVIVNGQDASVRGTAYFPGQTYSNGTATATVNTMGNTAYGTATYSGNSYTTPGTAVGFIKPRENVTVRFFREGEIDPRMQGVWDARSVLSAQR